MTISGNEYSRSQHFVPEMKGFWAPMGFAESSVTKTRVFWAQMGCDLWATLPVEAGNERHSANGGGRSVGLRPGAAGYIRGRAPDKIGGRLRSSRASATKQNRQPKKAAESFV